MRPDCLECVCKHLGIAQELLNEAFLGYPEFIHLFVGQMDQASAEAMKADLPLASRIREMRLRTWDGWWRFRTSTISSGEFALNYAPNIMGLLAELDERLLQHYLNEYKTEHEGDVEQRNDATPIS